jgi:hypothetical protein
MNTTLCSLTALLRLIDANNSSSKLLLFFLIFTGNFSTSAQSIIHGKLTDKSSKPLAHANVLLLNGKDSVLVKGMLTNEAGAYAFENISEGNYLLSYTHTGLAHIYSPVFSVTGKEKNMDMGIIKLDETEKQLAGVTVIAKKPLYEQKIDRLVINVASSITSTGSTALDVLQRSPDIMVDRINNTLSINGKNGVIVMMNGKRSYMELSAVLLMLAGIPSGNIERIEIITTPPANFDAEGNAGIINIVLKANNQFGTNGSYTLTAGYSRGIQNAASINLNHRKGKINLFGNYSFSRDHLKQLWTNYHAVTYAGNFLENNSESHRDAIVSQHDGQVGLDYEVSKKTIIGEWVRVITGTGIWSLEIMQTC